MNTFKSDLRCRHLTATLTLKVSFKSLFRDKTITSVATVQKYKFQRMKREDQVITILVAQVNCMPLNYIQKRDINSQSIVDSATDKRKFLVSNNYFLYITHRCPSNLINCTTCFNLFTVGPNRTLNSNMRQS